MIQTNQHLSEYNILNNQENFKRFSSREDCQTCRYNSIGVSGYVCVKPGCLIKRFACYRMTGHCKDKVE